jgi:hypothetical protein
MSSHQAQSPQPGAFGHEARRERTRRGDPRPGPSILSWACRAAAPVWASGCSFAMAEIAPAVVRKRGGLSLGNCDGYLQIAASALSAPVPLHCTVREHVCAWSHPQLVGSRSALVPPAVHPQRLRGSSG